MSIRAVPPVAPSRHDAHRHPRGGATNLYLVRHGRTAGNVQQRLIGSTDMPLDDLGRQQALLTGARVASDIRPAAIIASPLDRAHTTARAIGDRLGMTPQLDPGLVEMDFGDAEGLALSDLTNHYPDLLRRFDDLDDWDVQWPGGESRRGFHDRVQRTFTAILHDWHDHDIVVVAHGGLIASFLAAVQGLHPNDWRAYQIKNCSVTHLQITPAHTDVHLLNCTVHLESLVTPAATETQR